MNLQAHMAGQFSRQVPNQGGTSLHAIPQQQNIMQSSDGPHAPLNMEPGFPKTRQFIYDRIYEFLMQRQKTREMAPKNVLDIVRRLEEGLFKTAATKEEYLNLETLENRLHLLIRRPPYNHNQRYQLQSNASVAMGTMIPTPGVPQSANLSSMVPSSADSSLVGGNSMVSPAVNTGNFPLPVNTTVPSRGLQNGSFDGLIDGYQRPSNGSISSGGNTVMLSTGAQQMGSQMMPTPGYSNSTGVDSTTVSLPVQQKQQAGGQNSRMLHNLGSHMGGGIGSTSNQKAYGFSNGPLNSNLGTMGRSSQMINSLGTSEGFLTHPHYGNSHKPVAQYFDQQHQGQISQGVGNFSSASLMNINQVNLPVSQRSNSSLVVNDFLNSDQPKHIKLSMDQSEEMDFRSQQQPLHFQQQLLRSQRQQKQPDQPLPYGRSHLISDVGDRMKSEPGIERGNETFQSQVYEHFHPSQATGFFQQNSGEAGQLHGLSSGSQDMCLITAETSEKQQQSHFGVDNRNDPTRMVGVQPEAAALHGQWHSRWQQSLHELNNSSNQLNTIEEEFRQGIIGHDQGQRNNLSLEASMIHQTTAKRSVDPPITGAVCRPANLDRELQFKNQQRWLLFLRHARKCVYPPGNCPEIHCITAQKLLKHILSCNDAAQCQYPRCLKTKMLLHHHRQCRDQSCPVCIPVKLFAQKKAGLYTNLPQSGNRLCDSSADAPGRFALRTSPSVDETSEDVHPPRKRIKVEQPCQHPAAENENPQIPVASEVLHDVHRGKHQIDDTHGPVEYEVPGVKMEVPAKGSPKTTEARKDYVEDFARNTDGVSVVSNEATGFAKAEFMKTEKEVGNANQVNVAETSGGTKSRKPKIKGVSMIELFTPQQIREHITGLRKWVGQSKAKAEKNQAMELSMNENACKLCAVEKLHFEPPPIYCSPCGSRIKRNAMFYTIGSVDAHYYFCIPCYNETRGDTITVDGTKISKARLEKKKNDEDTEEPWVQCDKCESWQHQICALFNGRRNDGEAEYTCPNCYVEEVEKGERVPLPQSALLGAKDLPRTILSDHLENRLFKKLKQERLDRARFYGKSYDEVPGAESLVVRVVSSVDKKLEVKQRFLETFQEENYPSEFPYKSKVVLLFQKIEGVEVCLFGMYVQEFGTESEQPNQRRVYLSYLDSVKYFRPEIRTVTGEALRTFVYHEILIGYLEYCKLRGFTSCYIWACPPLKGEDYILYCHPEIQKTPKSDKLREWYLSMLRKASKENIVVDLTNLYDHFFVSSGECKAKVTAARLPYFDGDYWPGAAEDIIHQLRQEEDGRKHNKKGSMKRTITKRALKASGQMDLSGNVSKDLLLMHRLGETISPMKEDFIMVHLQHSCTHCRTLMVSGKRWVCNTCKNFQLCPTCYEIEESLEERERHPIKQRVKHQLYPVEINNVPTDTKDKDEILESEFFDTRQAFLSLCQGNRYQYDTLRRAKHSSMMALYHLHNPTAPAFVLACFECRQDIETGEGWRCEICPEYDVCNACYQKDSGANHPHNLTAHPTIAERDGQSKEARQLRVKHLRKMLDLLVHAAQCRSPLCQYLDCRKVKRLFRHGMHCKVRASGGCELCKRMWHLLQLHARTCKNSPCSVPRCRDLREHLRRLTQQADNRRRAAVMEMMRQRAAETSGSSG